MTNQPGKKLTPQEETELKKMQEEEEARKEAIAAANIQKAAAAAAVPLVPAPPVPKPPPQRIIGDIPVTCLKTESFCRLGGRTYKLQKGSEIMMDPSHAHELSTGDSPWVAPVTVVQSV
jgi:hypothetical protein